MDVGGFFSRLGRKPPAPAPHEDNSVDPPPLDRIATLHEFEAAWLHIQALLLEPDQRQLFKGITATNVSPTLNLLLDALKTELQSSEESQNGPYLEHALSHSLFSQLVELSSLDQPFGIRESANNLYTTLALVVRFMDGFLQIVSTRILSHHSVYQSLRQLLRHGANYHVPPPSATAAELSKTSDIDGRTVNQTLNLEKKLNTAFLEERLVYLWSSLLSSIEASPELLLIFFPAGDGSRNIDVIGIDLLTRYLHDETKIGVTARGAMSSLLQIAFHPHEPVSRVDQYERAARLSIAKHFCDDSARFVQVLIAGLGAIYSVLPNRISLDTKVQMSLANGSHGIQYEPKPEVPTDSLSSSSPEDPINNDVKRLFAPDVQTQLNLLLDLIAFTDQAMRTITTTRTPTDEINALRIGLQVSITSSLQASFIDNVLYPALLESSMEDGSATAVAAYLACIFEDESSMTGTSVGSVIINHLLDPIPSKHQAAGIQYTLRDFMVDMILHGSSDNTMAASTLLDAIMHKYCHQASAAILAKQTPTSTRFAHDLQSFVDDRSTLSTLASPSQASTAYTSIRNTATGHSEVSSATPRPSTSSRAIKSYLSLLQRLIPNEGNNNTANIGIQETYESDAFMVMSCHPCLTRCLGILDSLPHHAAKGAHPQLVMDRDGLFLKATICRFRNFFSSKPCANLELIQAMCNAAYCPMIGLTGWMTHEITTAIPTTKMVQDDIDSLDDPFLDLPKPRDAPKPAILILLEKLVNDIKRFRATVPDFDSRMAERRECLLGLPPSAKVEKSEPPAMAVSDYQTNPVSSTPTEPPRPGMISVLASYLTPRKQAGIASTLSAESKLATCAVDHKGTPTQDHQRQGTSVLLDSPRHHTPTVSASPYSISKRHKRVVHAAHASDTSSIISSEVYTSASTNLEPAIPRVTLESVLDNVVVLEAFIRQLVAILVARRTLGVDDLN
ncbi:hypothetical protein QFC21_004801 [Naganishia friedmannii]|uniref:Uncharacterized protein n=1 Tax=Naganishia friedmannii TaxID=89922 RepID=A0ACC2VEK4_9TREE|nr:hypothetical protein QFC21_004801 [Naganishia friedmannii]